ncbi:unnamed protein product, partial [Pylaiella littoralis]
LFCRPRSACRQGRPSSVFFGAVFLVFFCLDLTRRCHHTFCRPRSACTQDHHSPAFFIAVHHARRRACAFFDDSLALSCCRRRRDHQRAPCRRQDRPRQAFRVSFGVS